jgi:hypothetical protein
MRNLSARIAALEEQLPNAQSDGGESGDPDTGSAEGDGAPEKRPELVRLDSEIELLEERRSRMMQRAEQLEAALETAPEIGT